MNPEEVADRLSKHFVGIFESMSKTNLKFQQLEHLKIYGGLGDLTNQVEMFKLLREIGEDYIQQGQRCIAASNYAQPIIEDMARKNTGMN